MKKENRETMERAMGIVDGISFVVEEKPAEALITALEMMELVMKKEDEDGNIGS